MKYRIGKARGIESFVSIFLILLLVVIGAAIFAKQFYYDRSVFEVQLPELSIKIIPEEFAVSGFKAVGQAESYDKDNLYEKINGKAELYIPAGFAHGFKSLENNTIVEYMQTNEHSKENDCGIHYNSFGYNWNVDNPIITERDHSFESFTTYKSPFL